MLCNSCKHLRTQWVLLYHMQLQNQNFLSVQIFNSKNYIKSTVHAMQLLQAFTDSVGHALSYAIANSKIVSIPILESKGT